jgi:predicted TIM-barrel fold metal-dependent hydrolase
MTEESLKELWDWPIEGYLEKMEGVDRAIIQGEKEKDTLGIDVPNDYLANVVKKYPDKFSFCCGVDPRDEKAAQEVERCVKELGAIGVGELTPAYSGYYPNDERCFPVYEKAQQLGVPVCIHAGFTFFRNSRLLCADPLYVDDIAIHFPSLKIVICHFGHYKFEDTVFLMQKHENVFAEISELVDFAGLTSSPRTRRPVIQFPYYQLLHPLLYYFSQARGYDSDKLIWGTDMLCLPKESIEVLTHVNDWTRKYNYPDIPEESIYNILNVNWKKVFQFKEME